MGKFGHTDFAKHPEAEHEIYRLHDWYQSHLDAERWAPDVAIVERKVQSLHSATKNVMLAIQHFEFAGEAVASRLEFNEAISDLLRGDGLSCAYVNDRFDELAVPLDRLEILIALIQTRLAERLRKEGPKLSSSSALRSEFYQRLQAALVRFGLDANVSRNSLIVLLVLRLEGHESNDAATDEGRRKQVASDVKRAVKPQKGR